MEPTEVFIVVILFTKFHFDFEEGSSLIQSINIA